MLELPLKLTARQALDECHRAGLVVASRRGLAGRPGSQHWHLRMPDQVGTLELSAWRDEVWVKVHPRRQGSWTVAFARKLARQQPSN